MWQIRRQVRFTSWVEKSAPVLAGVIEEPLGVSVRIFCFSFYLFIFLKKGENDFFFPLQRLPRNRARVILATHLQSAPLQPSWKIINKLSLICEPPQHV